MSSMKRSTDTYHHGDLRNALITASIAILAEEGSAALTLRKAARKAGVSHAAPYRHFADKDALLAAIAEEGFQKLSAMIETAVTPPPPDPLLAGGLAYVRFGLENPDHLRVMFGMGDRDMANYPTLLETALKALSLLTQCIQDAQAEGRVKSGDPFALTLAMWSMLHGLTTLIIERKFPHMDCHDQAAMLPLAEQMIAVFINGLVSGLPA